MNIGIFLTSIGIGALIGYITNYIAIKLLFRPYKPIKLKNITVFPQGVIPREKKTLAKKVGAAVKNYILSEEEIKKIVTSDEVKKEIEKFLDKKINEFLAKDIGEFLTKEEIAEKLAEIISNVIKEKFSMFAGLVSKDMLMNILLKLKISLKISQLVDTEKVKNLLKNEVFLFLENEVPKIFFKAKIEKVVEEKVASFNEKTLEEMLFSLMKKHFNFINTAGAVLGAIIGAVQYLIIVNI